jgi:signal transduction histidine kinase
MNLDTFIECHLSPIMSEWEAMAEPGDACGQEADYEILRKAPAQTVLAVVDHMRSKQANAQSGMMAWLASRSAAGLKASVSEHASNRLERGFTLKQLVLEFRALRSVIVRQWMGQLVDVDRCDIEELECFNQVLDEALDQSIDWYVESLQESRDLLLGVLAHDLRNPLGAARNSAAYLLRSGGLDADQIKAIGCVTNSTTRMHHLVEDLLDFTRVRLGLGIPIVPVKSDIGDICRQVLEELAITFPERSLKFETSGPLHGEWDIPRIGQMVSNLAANAIQFGRTESPVSVTAHGQHDGIRVEVHNHGPAIPDVVQRRLFDPFSSAMRLGAPSPHPSDGSSGLHLGLYIASRIALAHGGRIDVESCALAGTRFTVNLPRMATQAAA